MQSKLLAWFELQGRHKLPWRNTKDIYHIYLSEIMLQQTQVNRVMEEYYPRFLEKFPSLLDLANASEAEVLATWSGLGYYSRARNLQKTAKLTYNDFPRSQKELLKLPGIGKYTASAICAFGYEQSVIVVDTNIKRVLRRVFALEENEKSIDEKAQVLLNAQNPREHNLALMDLGSMICSPKNPKCEECPFENECLGKDDIEVFSSRKKTRYEKLDLFLGVCIKNNKIALKKSNTNMYKNMLILPDVDPIEEEYIDSFKHAYTKYNITVYLYEKEFIEDDNIIWVDLDSLEEQPVASLITKAIDKLKK